MTMDTEFQPALAESPQANDQDMEIDNVRDEIINSLASNSDVCFKSQQRGEADLNKEQKYEIALELYNKNKLSFVIRFGQYLNTTQLDFFKQFSSDEWPDGNEIKILLKELELSCSKAKNQPISICTKNRRYEALKKMIMDGSYFSDIEMMKRNPLLYEQLVGQYLSEEEKRERDKYKMEEGTTFVKILLEGIERDNAELRRIDQETFEDNAKGEEEEEDSSSGDDAPNDPKPSTSFWGEFDTNTKKIKIKNKPKNLSITADERKLLKEEFITTMYQIFLDGDDEEFDYKTIDNDASLDNLEIMEHDAEDKYFDSEEPEICAEVDTNCSSEDELDIFMSALDRNHAVKQLSDDLMKI